MKKNRFQSQTKAKTSLNPIKMSSFLFHSSLATLAGPFEAWDYTEVIKAPHRSMAMDN
jgi:hypothetical protein